MGWMWLFGALVLIGIVLSIVVVVRVLGGGITRGDTDSATAQLRQQGRNRARELLDERYARGELSTEEYQERRRVLEDGS